MDNTDLQSFLLSRTPATQPSQDPKDWCALFIRYPQGMETNCYKTIMKYIISHMNIKHFLLAHEEQDDEHDGHFHLLLQCSDETYQNWIKAIKKNVGFSLGGKNSGTDGTYGKVKWIKNLNKMLSYTVKEGSYLASFGHTAWFKRQEALAYKKTKLNRQTFRQKLFNYLSDREYHDLRHCQIRIIDFYRCQEPIPNISRQAIKNHALNYFMILRQEGGILHTHSSEYILDILNNY